VEQGHTVDVLCNAVREDLLGEPGVRFVHLPMLRMAPHLSLWWSARRALAQGSWDAVMGFGRTSGHHLFRAGGGSHATYLRKVRPITRWSPGARVEAALDRHAARSARVCIANSRMGAEDLRRDSGVERVEVVYNGVDARRFRPDPQARAEVRRTLGADGPVALFLGTGFRRKGLDRAIAALPPGVALWVAGSDRPWRAPAHVRFLGPTHHPERLLQACDVLLLPTRYDPFANSCLEALACGVPFVTSRDNGAAEVAPRPWMVAADVDGWRAGIETALSTDVADACRAVAAGMDPAAGYARAFSLLREAATP
jgi:UDP-glucose:(heptosyl)LPS alpha-1,3-glucosyltransferase